MRICPICDKQHNKATTLVKLRGKYNPTRTHYQYPNLQWVHLPSGERIKTCTKCRKKIIASF
ncbi:hypothetical protein HY061_02645 [Candidatus Azambacteria bacterium]|nr:hypothetical protein [Candidatus Azambacteria bacterium]